MIFKTPAKVETEKPHEDTTVTQVEWLYLGFAEGLKSPCQTKSPLKHHLGNICFFVFPQLFLISHSFFQKQKFTFLYHGPGCRSACFVVARKVEKNKSTTFSDSQWSCRNCDGSGREFPTHTRIINRQNQVEGWERFAGLSLEIAKTPAI